MILISVVGLPRDYAEVIKNNALAIKGDNAILICPENLDNGDYSSDYIKKIISEMAKNTMNIPREKPISSVVFYVPFKEPAVKALKSKLFPHSLVMPIDQLDLQVLTKKSARQKANDLVNHLKKMAIEAKRRLAIIQHEVINNSNKTPILLPIKSFKSRHLQEELEALSEKLSTRNDTDNVLALSRKALIGYHPQKSKKTGGKKYFFDDRKLFFEAPCIAGPNHGGKSEGEDNKHRHICTLNGVSRLGGGFIRGFHYDCSVEKGNVRMDFKNCHDSDVSTDKEWVNIYPNDHVR